MPDVDARQGRQEQQVVITGAGGVRLATTDHGGPGRPIVLMHGLGTRRRSLAKLAGLLTGFRVVTMDLRGHGDSETAPWDFDDAVGDLAAVVTHYDLAAPYVAGHSLGGMVALRHAIAGHEVAGAINIDGWGPGVVSRFVGEDPALVTAELERLASGRLPSRIATAATALSRQSREGTMRQVLAQLRDADLVGWHREAPCPSLALHAVITPRGLTGRLLGAETARMQSAHHVGLTRDLAQLAEERDDVTVVEIEATHALYSTHADEVAAAIGAFAASLA